MSMRMRLLLGCLGIAAVFGILREQRLRANAAEFEALLARGEQP